MNDLHLSEHFTLAEFEKSSTATALGIDNSVPPHYIPVLQQLCHEVLEPLRRFVGQPIVVTSGYRCNQLNIKVGGAYASQHTLGEAADLKLPVTSYTDWKDNRRHTDLDEARRWMEFIEHHTDFDQIGRASCRERVLWEV